MILTMTSSLSIAAVIPTYRRPTLVIEAVNSVARQTLQPNEIILVESPSELPLVAEKFACQVTVLRASSRMLPGDARNLGAANASSDYIAFLDDDDLWEPTYLENIYAAILANQFHGRCLDLVYGQLFDERGKSARSRHFPDPSASLWVNPGITGSNMVIRKGFFDQIGGFDGRMSPSEDREILVRIVASTDAIQYVPSSRAIIREVSSKRISTRFLRGNFRLVMAHRDKLRKSDTILVWAFIILRLMGSLDVRRWRGYLLGFRKARNGNRQSF